MQSPVVVHLGYPVGAPPPPPAGPLSDRFGRLSWLTALD